MRGSGTCVYPRAPCFLSPKRRCTNPDRGPGHNLVTMDAIGEVAVIDLQRHGRELHRGNRLGLAGLQTHEARPLVDAFLNYPTESVVAMFAR